MKTKDVSVSLSDIAASCGVSRWAVSAVLFPSEKNKHVGCSEERRKAILAAAKRLKYRPHRASRNMQAQRHGVIGILTRQFFSVPLGSMHAMLLEARRYNQVISFEFSAPSDSQLPLFIRESVVDGIIVFESIDGETEKAIARHKIPCVHVNVSERGKSNSINMDEAAAIESAVQHLTVHGRKQIGLMLNDGFALYEQERASALKRACKRAEVTPLLLTVSDVMGSPALFEKRLADFFEQHPRCDALIAQHDYVVGMIFKICRKIGRDIPQQLAVICMQNPDRLTNFDPPVSAFELPEHELGRLAVEMLNNIISGKKPSEIIVPYAFIPRPSTE